MNTTIPVEITSILLPFAALFTKPVWGHAQTLVMGAILTTGKRTIIVMGLNQEEHFQNYHRVLNRTVWSSLEASRILLMIMVSAFIPEGPIIIGIDDTILCYLENSSLKSKQKLHKQLSPEWNGGTSFEPIQLVGMYAATGVHCLTKWSKVV